VVNFINKMTYYNSIGRQIALSFPLKGGNLLCREKAPLSLSSLRMSALNWKLGSADIRHRIVKSSEPRLSSSRLRDSGMMRSRRGSTCRGKSSPSGVSAFIATAWAASRLSRAAGAQPAFPPSVVVEVKRIACEAPEDLGLPLSRLTIPEVRRLAVARGLVAAISGTTVWRWLAADAIKPWRYRSWIFPRDPAFAERAACVLDLYAGIWQGKPLSPEDFVISADEKTSIQARRRCHGTVTPQPGLPGRVEHEYVRCGAWAYFAAWDVRRAKLFGRCEAHTGKAPFDRLVADVMEQEPYRSAPRVFWILDNGSSHQGKLGTERLQSRWSNLIVVHTPVHASWLNQIEIYFSIVERKALTPNNFNGLADVEARLLAFQARYETIAKPFKWTFTRQDLLKVLARVALKEQAGRPAA